MRLDPSPYCLPALSSFVRTSSVDGATRQSRGALELHCTEDAPAFAPFRTIFLLRSFITVVGQMDTRGLENEMKGTQGRAATRGNQRGRERRTEHTLHRTKCAMVVFHATSVWHMPHVFVRVGNIVRLTWHEKSWLRACNDLYV